MAGQIAGLVRDIKPVQEVIEELVLHTEQVLANLYQQGSNGLGKIAFIFQAGFPICWNEQIYSIIFLLRRVF